MKVGDVLDFKTSEGYKLVKLNDKRFFGNEKFKYSFLHISSFDQESLNLIPKESLSCKKGSERLDTGINITKFEEILLEEMNELFKNTDSRQIIKNDTDCFCILEFPKFILCIIS